VAECGLRGHYFGAPMPSQRRTHALLFTIAGSLIALACNSAPLRSTSLPTGGQSGASGSGAISDAGSITLSPDASVHGNDSATCVPVDCAPAGGRYCGKIGDGCGGSIDCPETCAALGDTCGGAGVAHVCGKPADPACKPATCKQPGGQLCGRVGDGCGHELACGTCPAGSTCGAVTPNVCGGPGAGSTACERLCKQQVLCPGGGTTRVTGVVLTPAKATAGAVDPLYNAVVYVPNGPVEAFKPGVACDRCGAEITGQPLATALSESDGRFTLLNVPAGKDIPLVIQIGRWRRQVKIPEVLPCQTTELPVDLTRMPRNQSEGDIPQIAVATGKWDPLECLLRKIGIDDSEFTAPTGKGRVHLYAYDGLVLGSPIPKGDALTGSLPALARYDLVLLPCDSLDPKPKPAMKNLADYTAMGGRIFMTDWSWSWMQDGGPFQSVAMYREDLPELGSKFGVLVDQSFPKGKAMARWLNEVKAAGAAGQVTVEDFANGISWYRELNPPAQRWLYTDVPQVSEVFSFNTPVGAPPAEQCGRVVYSGFHIDARPSGTTFPMACPPGELTPQEKVLEFMLFDVASCVQPDKDAPMVFHPPLPPPPPPPPEIQ
jgi:hypothetical protein